MPIDYVANIILFINTLMQQIAMKDTKPLMYLAAGVYLSEAPYPLPPHPLLDTV
jgi:hypothetical protein